MSKAIPNFDLKPVTVKTVKKIMGKMKKKKSAWADEISQECLLIGKVSWQPPLPQSLTDQFKLERCLSLGKKQ